MSMYGWKCDQIAKWLTVREAELTDAWGEAVYEVIRCSPWTMEMNVRLEDAVDKQARAERLAYMCAQPIPDADAALAELLSWVRENKHCPNGGENELPLSRGAQATPPLEPLPF
jgi:hypothetical protein